MIKTWLLKAALVVIFPIGIYVWFSNRQLAKANAALQEQEKALYERNVQREAMQEIVQQSQESHIASLEEESKVRANTASRSQVVDLMQSMKLRAAKRHKKRLGDR